MGKTDILELTEEEAYSLLDLCMTSEMPLDAETKQALEKLARFCGGHVNGSGKAGPSNQCHVG
ncbi:MAG: hypothetical protein IT207_00035 [Fimbriimonadaceae bacterium]|nr:hypothetical protein [Fimbriimonadaceae bacterium]